MRSASWTGLGLMVLGLGSGCGGLKRFAYEGFGRDGWQQPDRVVRTLGVGPGDSVADLGAGGGYFTFRLAEAVAPDGRVFAVDVDSDMTDYLKNRAEREGVGNVQVVLAETHDPGLPDASVDLIFTSNTYHHLHDRRDYFARLRRSLRPGGRVAIVEFARKGWFQRLFGHATEKDLIREEMESAGYALDADHDFLSRQSFLIFRASTP